MLGENIRYLRKQKNMSQDQLAELLGYKSYTTIQKWETGISEPPLKALKQMSEIFNCDMDEMATIALENIQYLKEVENELKTTNGIDPYEMELIEKYRKLDDYGRKAVNAVLDTEYDRCEDDESKTLTIDEEALRSMPTSTRLMFLKYQQDDSPVKLVARGKRNNV